MADPHGATKGWPSRDCATDAPPERGLSVVLVGRSSLAAQRRHRFVAGSSGHPARMAPDLAAHLIADYTLPGDWALDPLAGTGTSLVEAIHAGRNAVGLEHEPGWVALARANIGLARRQGGSGHARVICGDATRLPRGLPAVFRGRFSMVLTEPPYGRTMPGHTARTYRSGSRARPVGLTANSTASRGECVGALDGLTAVLAGCAPMLRPGGFVCVVYQPRGRHVVDAVSSGQLGMLYAGAAAGLTLLDRRRAVPATLTSSGPRSDNAQRLPSTRTKRVEIAVFGMTSGPKR